MYSLLRRAEILGVATIVWPRFMQCFMDDVRALSSAELAHLFNTEPLPFRKIFELNNDMSHDLAGAIMRCLDDLTLPSMSYLVCTVAKLKDGKSLMDQIANLIPRETYSKVIAVSQCPLLFGCFVARHPQDAFDLLFEIKHGNVIPDEQLMRSLREEIKFVAYRLRPSFELMGIEF